MSDAQAGSRWNAPGAEALNVWLGPVDVLLQVLVEVGLKVAELV